MKRGAFDHVWRPDADTTRHNQHVIAVQGIKSVKLVKSKNFCRNCLEHLDRLSFGEDLVAARAAHLVGNLFWPGNAVAMEFAEVDAHVDAKVTLPSQSRSKQRMATAYAGADSSSHAGEPSETTSHDGFNSRLAGDLHASKSFKHWEGKMSSVVISSFETYVVQHRRPLWIGPPGPALA